MPDHRDPYARSAEFIDLLIAPWWRANAAAVAEAVRAAAGPEGPVVDAGAGSGRGTRLLLRELPDAEVLAVEPSPALRSVLLARAADPDWGEGRVTVSGADLLSARLPGRIGGLLAMNILGHFPAERRAELWALLAERLAPRRGALVNLAPPLTPAAVPRTPMSEAAVGRRTYRGWGEARPTGGDSVVWRMTYRVEEDGQEVSSAEVEYAWHVLDEQGLRDEAARHGLQVRRTGPEEAALFLLHRSGEGRAEA
ncbi:class I SAM-dependent methyltransferase [Nocardiopsis composta]|uniref:SAM-dependent methyltransferase n=1 Tax=Nocardiopsis composta TaxID=157465 RepID=A0A7W8QJY6_9ACTN|nr:class I SAM-dependent methyltransferase [Nocardiopsis composta]MBB5431193.1 SAM-dependent methyltransferase [Nocardiopsis composta]